MGGIFALNEQQVPVLEQECIFELLEQHAAGVVTAL